MIIDNWLTKHGILHEKEVQYPGSKYVADWKIGNALVEYFGLARDSMRYDASIAKKRQYCKDIGLLLIEIYSKNLFPHNTLNEIFSIQTK
jgi:hypothetical protein